MRKKVYIIKGWWNLAAEMTFAAFERINADHVVVITALRYPQFLPEDFVLDLSSIECRVDELLKHWHVIDQEHLVSAEYANCVLDHGGIDVKVVEGDSLKVEWFYQTVRNYHVHFGQKVEDMEIDSDMEGMYVGHNDKRYNRQEVIDLFGPSTGIG